MQTPSHQPEGKGSSGGMQASGPVVGGLPLNPGGTWAISFATNLRFYIHKVGKVIPSEGTVRINPNTCKVPGTKLAHGNDSRCHGYFVAVCSAGIRCCFQKLGLSESLSPGERSSFYFCSDEINSPIGCRCQKKLKWQRKVCYPERRRNKSF